jgi:hypothetical protein
VASDPSVAKPASSSRLRPLRSVIAPVTGRISTCRSVETDSTYPKKLPGGTLIPSGWMRPEASAAFLAMDVRYGARKTVTTDVENTELAQS